MGHRATRQRPIRGGVAVFLLVGGLPLMGLWAAPAAAAAAAAAAQVCYTNCATTTTPSRPSVTITLTVNQGPVGTVTSITTCFHVPGHLTRVLFSNLAVLQGNAGSDGCLRGSFPVPAVVPSGTALGGMQLISAYRSATGALLPDDTVVPGTYPVTGVSDAGQASTTFTVTRLLSSNAGDNNGPLPRTGFQLTMWVTAALALLVVGRTTLVVARRRRGNDGRGDRPTRPA